MPAEANLKPPHAATDAAKAFLRQFIAPGPILIAISGGSDSKGLLIGLAAAIRESCLTGFSLIACTVDHGLRPESAEEARAVAAFCATRGIKHLIRRWEVEKPSAGLQAAAREARYALLAETARREGAISIVTGHTADDQAETIAMRQGRRVGPSPGLAGMADAVLYGRHIWILRPLLGVRRAAIRAELEARDEGWFDDPSNANRRFERVRVRQALAEGDMATTGDEAHAREASSARIAALLARHVTVYERLAARVDPTLLASHDDPDILRAILALSMVLGGRSHMPGRDVADRIAAFLAGGEAGRTTAGRVVFDLRRSGLYLYREARDLPVAAVAPGGSAVWDDRFTVRNKGPLPLDIHPGGEPQRLIDAGLVDAVAKRAAKAGFHCRPAGPHAEGASGIVHADQIFAEAVIRPYDTFLPRFDLMMANAFAALFGRSAYLPPPVQVSLTEMPGY